MLRSSWTSNRARAPSSRFHSIQTRVTQPFHALEVSQYCMYPQIMICSTTPATNTFGCVRVSRMSLYASLAELTTRHLVIISKLALSSSSRLSVAQIRPVWRYPCQIFPLWAARFIGAPKVVIRVSCDLGNVTG